MEGITSQIKSFRGAVIAGALGLALAAAQPAFAKVEGDTIYLGAAISITGKYSTNGKNTLDGYQLAVKRINEMGGVKVNGKSYNLEIVYYDDESTSARGAQLVERLINQDGIKFVLGPYSSGLTKAIAPVTEKYKIPMVEGNGADRGLFENGYRYLFAVLNTSDYYLREAVNLLAEQAKKHGKKPSDMRIAVAIENDNFSQDVRAGVLEDAKKYGMKVVIDDKLPPELNDMSATLTKVKALKPGDNVNPFVGFGIGTTYTLRNTNMNLYTLKEEAWNFSLQPELGLMFNIDPTRAFSLSAKYTHGFQAGNELLNAQSFLSINVGLVFLN